MTVSNETPCGTAMLIAQGIIPTPKPPPPPERFEEYYTDAGRDVDESEFDPDFESDPEKEDEIRYLIEEQERVHRELRELEDMRRLRVRLA